MTDYFTLKDILEMSEVLEDYEDPKRLECRVVNATNDTLESVVFTFNSDEELIGIYTEAC